MKALQLAIAASLALAGISYAGGIQGRVTDENGVPRRGVTISVKGYRQTTSTDSNGYYTLQMPAAVDGMRVNLYVNGNFAVNTLVPPGAANSTVVVTLIRR
jgi:hypothetical protein